MITDTCADQLTKQEDSGLPCLEPYWMEYGSYASCGKCDNCMARWRKQWMRKYDRLNVQPGRQSVVRFIGMTQQSIDTIHQYIYDNYIATGLNGAHIMFPPTEISGGYSYAVIFAEGLTDKQALNLGRHANRQGWLMKMRRNLTVTSEGFAAMIATLNTKRVEWNAERPKVKNTVGIWTD